MHAPADQARGKGFLAYTQKCHILRKVPVRKGKMNRQNGELEPFLYMLLDAILNFSPLKRVVKGHCSCRPLRESIHTQPEKVKCKCIKDAYMQSKHCRGVQALPAHALSFHARIDRYRNSLQAMPKSIRPF